MDEKDREELNAVRAEPRLKVVGEKDEMVCPNCGQVFSLLRLGDVVFHDQAECVKQR